MSQLPEGWEYKKIGEILDYEQPNQYITNDINDYSEEVNLPVLTANKSFILGYTNEKENIYNKLPVIIFDDFTTMNKFVKFPFKVKSSAIKFLQPKSDNVDLKFVYESIQLINVEFPEHKRRYISEYQYFKIPFPPLEEQKKIADILSTVDQKIAFVEENISQAEELKKGLMQKLLTEGIGHTKFKDSEVGKIPESWEEVSLDKLLTFKNGVNASKEQYGSGYKFINVLDIINNRVIESNKIIGSVDISEKEFDLYKVEYGDILFQRSSETREEVGQSNVYVDKVNSCTFGGFVIRGKKIRDYNPYFMNYLLKINVIRKQITSLSGGSTRFNIGQSSLSKVIICFPPLEEQKQISDILSTVDQKLEVLKDKKESFEELKKGLMQKLLTGEVRV